MVVSRPAWSIHSTGTSNTDVFKLIRLMANSVTMYSFVVLGIRTVLIAARNAFLLHENEVLAEVDVIFIIAFL